MSCATPKCVRASSTSLVFVNSSTASVTIMGIWGTSSIACPRLATVFFDAVAAIAESRARRFSFFGMCFVIFFCDVGGWGCLPPTVPGARAALPLPPFMRGTRDMPMPVPRDSALVLFPAIGSRPWGCRRVDWMASTARFMMSGLKGVAKMVGSVVFPMGFPWRL